jgi:sugar phosphate isomerase/epimerase
MRAPHVCTEPATHRRIVSPTFASRGASAYQIKNQLIDSHSAEGSKTQIRNPKSEIRTSIRFSERLVGGTNSRRAREANLLEVIDLILFSLIYSLTKDSNFSSAHSPRPFPSFALFAVISLFKSAFRNRLCVHGTADFLRNFEIFDFHFPTKNLPLLRIIGFQNSAGAARTECELIPCSTEPGIFHKKSVRPVHQGMYKIYNFTQIHTITFQLYTTTKPLHSNKLPFASTQKDKIPPPPLLYKFPLSNQPSDPWSCAPVALQIALTFATLCLVQLGIINSAFQQVGMDTATGLKHISRIGFDTVDIFTEAIGISAKEITTVAKTTEKLGLPVVSLPVVAVGLIDFNEPVRKFHIERCKKFIDLAKTWNAKNILLVLGEYIWQKEVIPPEAQWQWALETCRELGDYAARRKIDIALELEPFRLSLLNNISEMVRFIDDCDHPRVRANIDISHLVLSDTGPAQVKELGDRAIHVHLSDCDGKVHGDLPPGRGIVKFAPYLQAIKELHIEGVISIELEYSPEPAKIVEWVEEAYCETARLMDLVGLRNSKTG